ncbi:MAG TPA: hypothetical protein VFQ75_11485, partial [Candidatus Limnocylindrales bacterium]|nr:hypothetical protein [Candidatus Limnocylindrales bacterium]
MWGSAPSEKENWNKSASRPTITNPADARMRTPDAPDRSDLRDRLAFGHSTQRGAGAFPPRTDPKPEQTKTRRLPGGSIRAQ